MLKIASSITLGLGLGLFALQPASAETLRQDIHRDIREVRQDRQAVERDEARVARERAELNAARINENRALAHGNVIGVVKSYEQIEREARELTAANRQLAQDRAKLNAEKRDLHRDIKREERREGWGG